MFKKALFFLCLFLSGFVFSIEKPSDLSFYKETPHFQAYCSEQDFAAAESILQDLEEYWIKWDQEVFSVTSSEKIKLNIFPDIQSYNLIILETASYPDWSVCGYSDADNAISLVSPRNPGPVHTKESIIKCGRFCLGIFFTHQKCGKWEPVWLINGLSFYKAQLYSKEQIYQYLLNKNNEIEIPSLTQLENLSDDKLDRSLKLAYYVLSEFLVNTYGMDKALAVLDNYAAFEKILGISKEEFREKCAKHYQPKEPTEKN